MNEMNTGGSLISDLLKDLSSPVEPVNDEKIADAMPEEPAQPEVDVSGLKPDDFEEKSDFDYDGYQVVRREFFAHIAEPSITFCDYKVSVNQACLNKLPNVEYVQMLVNSATKTLALRPCNEFDRDSFPWATAKRKPKSTTCKVLFVLLIRLMGWNPDYRYKMLGKLVHSNGEWLYVFDLTAFEVFQRTVLDDGKVKASRKGILPGEWEGQFGLPFAEHQKTLKINTFEGYAVLTVREKRKNPVGVPDSQPASDQALPEDTKDGETPFNIPIMINEGGKHYE